MKVLGMNQNKIINQFSKTEFGIIRSSLAEITGGFKCDIQNVTGWNPNSVDQLYKVINREYNSFKKRGIEKVIFEFLREEISVIIKSIAEVMKELEISEYQTRTGYKFKEAKELLESTKKDI